MRCSVDARRSARAPRGPSAWLALGACAAALSGCPAEQLGVEIVRRGGAEAIAQEDLRRDIWRLTEAEVGDRSPDGEGYTLGRERIIERLEEMHLIGAFNGRFDRREVICGIRRGKGRGQAIVVAQDDRRTLSGGAIPIATLISLAKANDTTTPPEETWLYCVAPEGWSDYMAGPAMPLEETRGVVLGPMRHGADLRSVEEASGDARITTFSTAGEVDALESIDFEALREQTVQIWTAISPQKQRD